MNRLRNSVLQFGKGCAFLALSAATCFASCAGQNERSGYQGIPVRNGLNRGVIDQAQISGTHAYSGLPQRLNQTDECAESFQASVGYSGIPQTSNSKNAVTPDDVPDMLPIDSAAYRGIPQAIDAKLRNDEFARTASAFVGPK